MQKLSFVLMGILLFLAGSAAVFGQRSAVMKPINQFVNGFNKGDTASAMAACSETTAVIDEFAPHSWSGPGACQAWADSFEADAKQNHITNGKVILGKPSHFESTADYAYVVIPSNYTFKQRGKSMAEPGSFFTFALQKAAGGWQITAWTWSTTK
jgi:SnoaL-like domain